MSILLDPPSAVAPPTPVALRPRTALAPLEVAAANELLADASPDEIVRWALDTFGTRLVVTASFADTTLIDIATGVEPDIEVVFLDTGFHFAETLNVVRRAIAGERCVTRPSAALPTSSTVNTTRGSASS